MSATEQKYIWTDKDAYAIGGLLPMKREGRTWLVIPPAINNGNRIREILRTGGLVEDVLVPPQPGGYTYGFHARRDDETFYAGLVVARPDLNGA